MAEADELFVDYTKLIPFSPTTSFAKLMRILTENSSKAVPELIKIDTITELRRLKKYHWDFFKILFNNILERFIKFYIDYEDSTIVLAIILKFIGEIFSEFHFGCPFVESWIEELFESTRKFFTCPDEKLQKLSKKIAHELVSNMFYESTAKALIKAIQIFIEEGQMNEVIFTNILFSKFIKDCKKRKLLNFDWNSIFDCFYLDLNESELDLIKPTFLILFIVTTPGLSEDVDGSRTIVDLDRSQIIEKLTERNKKKIHDLFGADSMEEETEDDSENGNQELNDKKKRRWFLAFIYKFGNILIKNFTKEKRRLKRFDWSFTNNILPGNIQKMESGRVIDIFKVYKEEMNIYGSNPEINEAAKSNVEIVNQLMANTKMKAFFYLSFKDAFEKLFLNKNITGTLGFNVEVKEKIFYDDIQVGGNEGVNPIHGYLMVGALLNAIERE